MIELREDLVLLKQVEDKTKRIVMVGAADDHKKYYNIVVVQVGSAVTRCKADDRVYIAHMVQPIMMDPFGTGLKEQYIMVTESAIYAREI